VRLGKTGLKVSRICLGAMSFGDPKWQGWVLNEEDSRPIIKRALELGINFFDTANIYSAGESEKFLGQYVSSIRSRAVVATKYTFTNYGIAADLKTGNPLLGGNSRKSLVENIDESLKRLGLGYIDLLYVHAWEYRTPIAEVMRSLDDVVRSGKVLYTGISDSPAWVISKCNTLAEFRGWSPYIALQTRYNLLDRSHEFDLAPMASDLGIGTVPWGSLAEGFLSGKYKKGEPASSTRFRVQSHTKSEQNWQILKVVQDIAQESNRTPSQVALNWLLNKGCTSPLVGARTVAQLEDNLATLQFSLSPDQMARLDTVSAPQEVPFPHSMIAKGLVEKSISAGKKITFPPQFKGLL